MRQTRWTPRVARAALAALSLASVALTSAAVSPLPSAGAAGQGANAPRRGGVFGVVPSTGSAPPANSPQPGGAAPTGASCAGSCAPLTYQGGPVQHRVTVYAIYWQPSGYPESFPAGYSALINQYLADVAHDSFATSNVFAAATQYSDTTAPRFVSYDLTSGGAITDTAALPASDCAAGNYTLADGHAADACIVETDLATEVSQVAAAHGLLTGLDVQYLLFTPPHLGHCVSTSDTVASGNCFDPSGTSGGFCAYHGATGPTPFSNMPFMAMAGCDPGQRPNPGANPGDAEINPLSHEMNETITDPYGTAWWNTNDGFENGDRCNFVFGTVSGTSGHGFNQTINGHNYLTQLEYSNRVTNCVATNTFAQPTASFASAPSTPAAGTPVAFTSTAAPATTGHALSYAWTFGDGSSSTTANPSHSFATSGTYPVGLVVYDTVTGDQVRVVNNVVVGTSTPNAPAVASLSPISGPAAGATTVTINGSHFTGATAVAFGTTAATGFTVVSDTRITATSPAHASGTVDVRITTPAGESAVVSADRYTYASSAPPRVSAINPTSGPRAGGTTVTITGTNFTGATRVLFGTASVTTFTVVSPTQITVVSPAGRNTVHVRVTTPLGTSGGTAVDRFTYA